MSMAALDLIRPELRARAAYRVPEAHGLIKLDAMENPYPLPAELRAAWLEALRDAPLHRYPDPRAPALHAALRDWLAPPAGIELLLGNGSDELIQMVALAVSAPGRALLTFEPGFAMYRLIAEMVGLEYVGVPLRADDFGLDCDAALAAIADTRPALIFIAYPNNPTGNLFEAEAIARIVAASPGVVVIDEAYAPFAEASFVPRLGEWPHLMVLRTLSKLGLAGLRLGCLLGRPEWLAEIDKTRLPYNINVLTQRSAVFAWQHRAVFAEQSARIRAERARLAAALALLPGVRVYPSAANFVLLRLPTGTAGAVFAGLIERGVLVKNLAGSHPLLADHLRITVGTPEENAALLTALGAALRDSAAVD